MSSPARSKKSPINPFYVLLVLAGCAFAVTAFAYGVMTVRQLHLSRTDLAARALAEQAGDAEGFDALLDRHGPTWLTVELVLLGLCTAGAIGLDQYRDNRQENSARPKLSDAPRTSNEEIQNES